MDICIENDIEVMYRYKYLPLDEGSLKILTEGTLKFTCPLEFNDPFDCMPSYDPASIDNLDKIRPDLIKQAGAYHKLSPAKRLQRKGVFVQNIRRAVESGDFAKGLISKLGVLSLSRIPTNILMWSHYADHHKGFVVELRIPMDAPHHHLYRVVPQPVEYLVSRPTFSLGTGCDINGYFFTKSLDWKYEQEERVLTTVEGPGIHSYSREHFLSAVIAGAKMQKAEILTLRAAILKASKDIERDIPLYIAKLASDKYKVHAPGHPNPEISD
jgi:hypothetical protein